MITGDFHYDPDYKILIYKKNKTVVERRDRQLGGVHMLIERKEGQPLLDYYDKFAQVRPKDVADKWTPFKRLEIMFLHIVQWLYLHFHQSQVDPWIL